MRARLEHAKQLTATAVRCLRSSLQNLREGAPVPDEELPDMLLRLAARHPAHELGVSVEVTGPRVSLAAEVRQSLFQIASECVFNAAIHGRAHRAVIRLSYGRGVLALGIDVRRDVMGDLSGGVAQPHALVEGRGAEPGRAVLIQFIPAPEANMMPLARAAGHRLLEGEILFAAEQEQIAHRRIVVGAAEHGVGGDAHAACHGDRVRRVPACRLHGAHEVGLVTGEADIDRIAGVSVSGLGDAIDPGNRGVAAVVDRPQPRHDEVGGDGPSERDQDKGLGVGQMQGCYPAFQGAGCAISTASASMMTEALKGKTRAQAEAFEREFWGGSDLVGLYQRAASGRYATVGMERIFEAGFKEFLKLKEMPPEWEQKLWHLYDAADGLLRHWNPLFLSLPFSVRN